MNESGLILKSSGLNSETTRKQSSSSSTSTSPVTYKSNGNTETDPLKPQTREGFSILGQYGRYYREEGWEQFKNILCILLNVTSAVGVVMANKTVFSIFDFKFGTVVTVMHFVFTSIVLRLMIYWGLFSAKQASLLPIIPLSLSFCGFVVLTNLSLQYNSVGFYQMAKVLTTPCVVLIQSLFYEMRPTRPIIITLAITCAGVIVATFAQVNFNATGVSFALGAVLVTSLYQVWIGAKQKELGLNAMQLLCYQAPISAVLLTFWIPYFDSVPKLLVFPYSITCIVHYHSFYLYVYTKHAFNWSELQMAIIVSGIMAVLVNVSTFLIIGRTSAITYNMVGHGKLVLILLCGYLFFDGKLSFWNLFGVLVALVGIMSYSYITLSVVSETTNTNTTINDSANANNDNSQQPNKQY